MHWSNKLNQGSVLASFPGRLGTGYGLSPSLIPRPPGNKGMGSVLASFPGRLGTRVWAQSWVQIPLGFLVHLNRNLPFALPEN